MDRQHKSTKAGYTCESANFCTKLLPDSAARANWGSKGTQPRKGTCTSKNEVHASSKNRERSIILDFELLHTCDLPWHALQELSHLHLRKHWCRWSSVDKHTHSYSQLYQAPLREKLSVWRKMYRIQCIQQLVHMSPLVLFFCRRSILF